MTSQFKHICDVIIMRKVFLLGVEDLFQSTHSRRFGYVFRNLDIFSDRWFEVCQKGWKDDWLDFAVLV